MIPIDRRALLRGEYMSRINRVIDYVDRQIGRDVRLDELARVANFSPFHFHRIFGALVGETLMAFIQRVRAERAANALLNKPKASITEIALEGGYSGSAAFARAFRERFGMSASEWRTGGSEAWDALMRDWLPGSGYQPDDQMGYEVYLNDSKAHPQGKFVLEICEPIRPLKKDGFHPRRNR